MRSISVTFVMFFLSTFFFPSFSSTHIPSVTFISPRKNDVLLRNVVYIIQWNARKTISENHVVSRAIYFTSDDRNSWTLIDSAEGNTGEYSWIVPNAISAHCALKIFVYDSSGTMCSYETRGLFSIVTSDDIFTRFSPEKNNSNVLHKERDNVCLLQLALTENNDIHITDLYGKPLFSFKTREGKEWYQLPLCLTPGMYILTLRLAAHETRIMSFKI